MAGITVSIVSHGHGALLPGLLEELSAFPEIEGVILTRNIPESGVLPERPGWLLVIENPHPKGFGANHNTAFQKAGTPFFVVLNPDIRFDRNPFPALLACMQDDMVALCAPAVVNPAGDLEDSARHFPSLLDLLLKGFGGHDGRLHYAIGNSPMTAPWVAGMFMLLRSSDYAVLEGFDEGYFLYYEDVDLCARLWRSGRKVMLCPAVQVVHDARRASRHDLRHMRWHATSMGRYLRKYALRKLPLK